MSTALLMLSGTPTAWAHATRVATDPPENASVATSPALVSATFNEPMQTVFAAMTVMPLGPVGTYTVNYRAASADGHVVSGSWSFELTKPGSGHPGRSAAAGTPDPGLPIWPFLVGTVVLIADGALWAVRRRS